MLYRKRHREGDFRVWSIDKSRQRREERAFWTENICKQHKECNRGVFRSLKVVGVKQRTGCQTAGWVTTSDAFIKVHVDHVPICFRSGHALLSFKPLLWPSPSKTRVMQTRTPIYSSRGLLRLSKFSLKFPATSPTVSWSSTRFLTSYHPIHFLAPMPLLKLFLSMECFLPPFHWSTFYFSLKTHLKSLLSPHTFPYFPSLCSHIPQFNFALQCSPSHICFFQLEQELAEGTGNLCYLLCVPSPWPGMWSLINICFEWHVVSSPLWSHWCLL